VNHLLVPPDAELHGVPFSFGHHVDIDVLAEPYVGDLDGVAKRRDTPVPMDDSGLLEAEDVLG
jgi:hypothetical protein